MKLGIPYRAAVGVLLLVGFASWSSFHFIGKEKKAFTSSRNAMTVDQISLYEKRFDALKKSIPSSQVVGFLHDSPFGSAEWSYAYTLTQYALVPRIVADSADMQLVIGNFHRSLPGPAVMKEFVRIRDFGNGVFLLRKTGK